MTAIEQAHRTRKTNKEKSCSSVLGSCPGTQTEVSSTSAVASASTHSSPPVAPAVDRSMRTRLAPDHPGKFTTRVAQSNFRKSQLASKPQDRQDRPSRNRTPGAARIFADVCFTSWLIPFRLFGPNHIQNFGEFDPRASGRGESMPKRLHTPIAQLNHA